MPRTEIERRIDDAVHYAQTMRLPLNYARIHMSLDVYTQHQRNYMEYAYRESNPFASATYVSGLSIVPDNRLPEDTIELQFDIPPIKG